jgi:hypothetical protein
MEPQMDDPKKLLMREISHRAQERAKIPPRHEHAPGTSDLQCDLCDGYRERYETEFVNDERAPELRKMLGRE